jgi:hypothetical protein
MPEQLEYVITGALMQCSEGTVPGLFQTSPRTTKIGGLLAGNELDKAPIANIPSFIICKKLTQQAGGTPVPCMPAPTQWQDPYQVKVGGGKALLFRSCIQCSAGQGKIEFITSGQTPVPPEISQQMTEMKKEADDALAEAEKEKDSVGEAGFFEGMIPIWGSGRDLVHSIQTGDGWGMALNAGFLVWDAASIVAGALSFGTATAAMMGAKTGIRAAVKAAGKVKAKMAAEKATQLVTKSVALKAALKEGIPNLAAKIPKLCVTACFPAGTPIAVKGGYKKIEDVQKGDLVWSWNEETGDLALKRVVATMRKQSDALIEIQVADETIRATPEHPFWVDGQWKEAGELEKGDELLRSDGFKTPILNVKHHTESSTEVYNFEVAEWHTYFVGYWMWLVHNAKICLTELTEAAKKAAQEWIEKHKNELKETVSEKLVAPILELADQIRSMHKDIRPSIAGGMELLDGSVIVANSRKMPDLPEGIYPLDLHKDVIDVLETVPPSVRNRSHGRCAEPQIISKAIKEGKDVKGAKSLAVKIRGSESTAHTNPMCACNSCKVLLDHFGINDVIKD